VESLPPQENKKGALSEKLTSLEELVGLNKIKSLAGIDSFLILSPEELSIKTRKEITSIAFSLSRYSLYIANEQSHFFSKFEAAKKFLDRKLAELSIDFEGFTFDERKMAALNDSEELRTLYDNMTEWEMYSNRLRGLSFKIEELIKRIESFTRL
jgi:hypothetical protein